MNQKVVTQNFIIEPTDDKYFRDIDIYILKSCLQKNSIMIHMFIIMIFSILLLE